MERSRLNEPFSSKRPFVSQGFYDEVSNVLLSDVNFHYPDNMVNSLTGSNFKQLFNGSEIVVAGRLNDLEMNDLPIEVSAQLVRARQQRHALQNWLKIKFYVICVFLLVR